MSAKYLIRFDDICPTMKWSTWEKVEDILLRSNVKPILAVVPDNQDPSLRAGGTKPTDRSVETYIKVRGRSQWNCYPNRAATVRERYQNGPVSRYRSLTVAALFESVFNCFELTAPGPSSYRRF